MRILLAFLVLWAVPAHAEQAPLSREQMNMLQGMADSMRHRLHKAYSRHGAASSFEKPRVTLDLPKRRLSIVNRFRRNPRGAARKQVREAMAARVPGLCLAFRQRPVRETGLEIVVRAEMRSGSPIAKAVASPARCPL